MESVIDKNFKIDSKWTYTMEHSLTTKYKVRIFSLCIVMLLIYNKAFDVLNKRAMFTKLSLYEIHNNSVYYSQVLNHYPVGDVSYADHMTYGANR